MKRVIFLFKDRIHKISNKLIRCVYPEHCPVCDEIIPLMEDYCFCSRDESKKISKDYCRHCGQNSDNCTCGAENSVYLPDIAAVYYYSGKIRADILNFKFNNCKKMAVKLGEAMAERCAIVYCDVDFDFVTFVPMTKESYLKRGYNQSQLLAEVLAEKFFLPVEDLLVKTKNTASQRELGGKERIENLKGSIRLKKDVSVKGKTILVCDDVKTTGSTLGQCVKALEEAGAHRVCCLSIAVTEFLG